jgi:hypothetical protein
MSASNQNDKITIVRSPHNAENPYCQIRRTTLQDERLSFEARGLLAYLLSKSHDWRVVIGDLMRAGNTGRDRVYRILRELESAGYLTRHAVREGGKWRGFEYHVYEAPLTDLPYTEKPDTGKPYTEKPDALKNREELQKRDSTEDESSLAPGGAQNAPAPKSTPSRKKKPDATPAPQMNAMKDAIVSAFGWAWATMS